MYVIAKPPRNESGGIEHT